MQPTGPMQSPLEAMESAMAAERGARRHVLRLYIVGSTTQSNRAVANIRRICEKYLKGSHDLEVLDLLVEPARAKKDDIIASPTLIKLLPLPTRRFVGDLSGEERIVTGLGLVPIPPGKIA